MSNGDESLTVDKGRQAGRQAGISRITFQEQHCGANRLYCVTNRIRQNCNFANNKIYRIQLLLLQATVVFLCGLAS